MEFFEGMTDEQIVALSDAELNMLVDRECAEQGIPLYLKVGDPPDPVTPPDQEYWRVCGELFATYEDAERAVKAMNAGNRYSQEYHWSTGSQPVAKLVETEMSPERVMLYKRETYSKLSSELTTYKAQKAEYDKRVKDAEDSCEKRQAVWSKMWKLRSEASNRLYDNTILNEAYEQYVILANGDREMARQFLIRAKKLDADWMPKGSEIAEEVVAAETSDL